MIFNTPSEEASVSGFKLFNALLTLFQKEGDRGTVPIPPSGIPARLIRPENALEKNGKDRPGSFLHWRYGTLIAMVQAAGMDPLRNDQAALHFAQIQQQRMEAPTPYTEAERDDTEVMLDDPGLKLPVYWLGGTFEPENSTSTAELQTATVLERDGLPGSKLELRYDGFNLETWTRRSWRLFQGSILGKLNRPPCTRTHAFEWEQEHATISAGYRRRTFDQGCPDYPPTRYWAVAHVGGVVIGVNQTTCRCLSPGFGPFSESLRGMKTILRGLTLRPQPVYAVP